jgi:hypothetical protein
LITDELVQTKEPKPLPVGLEDLQHVEFEPVNNYLTHGSIIKTNVLVHYYHDVPIEDNNAIVRNDQNDTFSETLIDIYILKVYNPKGYMYSQP